MRINRTWVLVPALFLLAALLSIGLTPVTLTVDGGLPEGAIERGEWEEVPEATPSTVVIRSDADGAAIGRPVMRRPELFNEELVAEAQGFRADPTTGGFVADGPGRLVLRGVFGDLSFTVLPDATGSVTVVRRSLGRQLETTLEPGETVRLRPPVVTYQRTTAFLWRSIPARLADPGQANLRARVGNLEIDAAGSDAISFGAILSKALAMFLQGLLLFAVAALAVLLSWLVGRSIDPVRDAGPRRVALQAFAGAALAALAANSLSYILPSRISTWIILAVALVLILVRRPGFGRGEAEATGRMLKLLGLALIPAAFLFYPALHWGFWYGGQYNTDLFEYTRLASLLREDSLFALRGTDEALTSGLLTAGAGFEWRSIDSALASVVGVGIFGSSLAGVVAMSLALFLLFAIGVLAFSQREQSEQDGRGGIFRTLIALAVLVSPAPALLFAENYQSHYFLVCLLPGLVLAARELFGRERDSRPAWRECLLAGAISGAVLLPYPHFAAFALAAVAAAPLVLGRAFKATLAALARTALAALVLINVGVLTLPHVIGSQKHQEALDTIASDVLLAPYSKEQIVSLAAGITPYSWRWPEIEAGPFMGQVAGEIWAAGDAAWTAGALEIAAALLAAICFLIVVDWRRSLKDTAFVAASLVVLAYASLVLFFAATDSPYSAFKLGWTAVAAMPLVVVSSRLRPRLGPVLAVALVPICLLWIRTDLVDRVGWMITREGTAASRAHASIQPELERVRDELTKAEGPVAVMRGVQPITGSDRGTVGLNHVRDMIRELDLDCPGCAGYPLRAEWLSETVACDPAPATIISIGRSAKRSICGRKLTLAGPTIEIYRLPLSRPGEP